MVTVPQLLVAGAVLTGLIAGPAMAADLARPLYRRPVAVVAPVYTWTGFYVGLNAGYTWSQNSGVAVQGANVFAPPGALGLTYGLAAAAGISGVGFVRNDGFIGGGQVGYNWQFGGPVGPWGGAGFVAGVEADIQGVAGGNHSSSYARAVDRLFPAPGINFIDSFVTVSKRLDYLGTVRGRLGYLVKPSLLAYATGGLAYGGARSETTYFGFENPPLGVGSTPFFGAAAFSNTRVGWTVGGGLEWMFMPNLSAKAEYLYYDLGSVTYASTTAAFALTTGNLRFIDAAQSSTRFNGHVVRVGLNYKFNNYYAPLVTK